MKLSYLEFKARTSNRASHGGTGKNHDISMNCSPVHVSGREFGSKPRRGSFFLIGG